MVSEARRAAQAGSAHGRRRRALTPLVIRPWLLARAFSVNGSACRARCAGDGAIWPAWKRPTLASRRLPPTHCSSSSAAPLCGSAAGRRGRAPRLDACVRPGAASGRTGRDAAPPSYVDQAAAGSPRQAAPRARTAGSSSPAPRSWYRARRRGRRCVLPFLNRRPRLGRPELARERAHSFEEPARPLTCKPGPRRAGAAARRSAVGCAAPRPRAAATTSATDILDDPRASAPGAAPSTPTGSGRSSACRPTVRSTCRSCDGAFEPSSYCVATLHRRARPRGGWCASSRA